MKKTIAIALSMLLLLGIAGCSASSAVGSQGESPQATTTYSGDDGDWADEAPMGSGNTPDGQDIQRQIIKNAYLSLEARDVEAAYSDLLAYAAQRGGYEAEKNQRTVNDQIMIDAAIKIAPKHLDDFLAYAEETYDLISSQVSTEDITSAYYDIKTRLATKEKALATYYAFLDDAQDIEESLKVQNEINQLTEEIESLKGQLAVWDSLLAESTVTIMLRQLSDPVESKREINWSTLTLDDMSYLMRAGLTAFTNAIVVFLQWAAIVLVVLSPLWIIGLIVLWIVLRAKRKKRAKQASEEIQSPENKDPGEN